MNKRIVYRAEGVAELVDYGLSLAEDAVQLKQQGRQVAQGVLKIIEHGVDRRVNDLGKGDSRRAEYVADDLKVAHKVDVTVAVQNVVDDPLHVPCVLRRGVERFLDGGVGACVVCAAYRIVCNAESFDLLLDDCGVALGGIKQLVTLGLVLGLCRLGNILSDAVDPVGGVLGHEGDKTLNVLIAGAGIGQIVVIVAGYRLVQSGNGDLVKVALDAIYRILVVLCKHTDLICGVWVGKGAVETELLAQLGDLVNELIESAERIVKLVTRETRMLDVVDKLLILTLKLRQSLFCGLGIVDIAVVEPVELVYCLLHGILKSEQEIVHLFVEQSKVALRLLYVVYLIGNVDTLVADEVYGVAESVVGVTQGVYEGVVCLDKLIDGGVVAAEVVTDLYKRVLEELGGGVALNVGGEGVELAEQRFDDRLNVLLVDLRLDVVGSRLDYLDGDGVRLFVLIELYGGLEHIRREEIVHIICKVLFDYDRSVIGAVVNAVYRLVRIVEKDVADVIALTKLLNKLASHVDDVSVGVQVVLVVGNDRNFDVAGFAVRIPVSIDVEPRIERRQDADCYYNKESKKVPAQRVQVVAKDSEYITHIGQYSYRKEWLIQTLEKISK